jgi:hypothetical protein
MRRSVQAITNARDTDIGVLQRLTFTKVALASVPRLYLFYLTSFGKILTRRAKASPRQDILAESRKTLTRLLLASELDPESEFTTNALGLLVAMSDDVAEHAARRILLIIQQFLPRLISGEDGFQTVRLLGLFSAVSHHLMHWILPLFAVADFKVQRTVMFTLRELIRDGHFYPVDGINIKKEIYAVLHASFHVVMTNRAKNYEFALFLDDFGDVLTHVFQKIVVDPKPGFIFVNNRFCLEHHRFNTSKQFSLFVTFTTEEVIFHKALMAAFAGWLEIWNTPNNVKTECLYSIPEISRSEKLLPSRIRAADSFQLFDFFLMHAGQGCDFFLELPTDSVSAGCSGSCVVGSRRGLHA